MAASLSTNPLSISNDIADGKIPESSISATGQGLLGAPPLPILEAKERALEREEGSLGTLPNLPPAINFSFVGPHEVIKDLQRYYFGLGTEMNNIFNKIIGKLLLKKLE